MGKEKKEVKKVLAKPSPKKLQGVTKPTVTPVKRVKKVEKTEKPQIAVKSNKKKQITPAPTSNVDVLTAISSFIPKFILSLPEIIQDKTELDEIDRVLEQKKEERLLESQFNKFVNEMQKYRSGENREEGLERAARFLILNGFFEVPSKKFQEKLTKLYGHADVVQNASQVVAECATKAAIQLLGLLSSSKKGANLTLRSDETSWSQWAYTTIQKMEKSGGKLLKTAEDEEEFSQTLETVQKLTQDAEFSKNVPLLYSLLLHAHACTEDFDDAEEISETIGELENISKGEEGSAEVYTDLMVSLLSKNSILLKQAVRHAFEDYSGHTFDSLMTLVDAMSPEDDDDDEMEEDHTGEGEDKPKKFKKEEKVVEEEEEADDDDDDDGENPTDEEMAAFDAKLIELLRAQKAKREERSPEEDFRLRVNLLLLSALRTTAEKNVPLFQSMIAPMIICFDKIKPEESKLRQEAEIGFHKLIHSLHHTKFSAEDSAGLHQVWEEVITMVTEKKNHRVPDIVISDALVFVLHHTSEEKELKKLQAEMEKDIELMYERKSVLSQRVYTSLLSQWEQSWRMLGKLSQGLSSEDKKANSICSHLLCSLSFRKFTEGELKSFKKIGEELRKGIVKARSPNKSRNTSLFKFCKNMSKHVKDEAKEWEDTAKSLSMKEGKKRGGEDKEGKKGKKVKTEDKEEKPKKEEKPVKEEKAEKVVKAEKKEEPKKEEKPKKQQEKKAEKKEEKKEEPKKAEKKEEKKVEKPKKEEKNVEKKEEKERREERRED
ncbi:erythrocyte binding protein [Planoprotostelium fungivorum]|uniref:Erythrocyte binding protein n=1 Tax=Planoprotostelium fungivorum TaxID=1890364 RepID=A0A2P6P072_9EUKA|nr:erythrocyte binding protein [Planoprotostelium fungivorum]